MSRLLVTLTTGAVLLAGSAVPSFADHHGGGHGGCCWHGGTRVVVGVGFGFPAYGYGYYGYPYYPYYPYYPAYYPGPVVQQQPAVYVEQPQQVEQQPQASGYWYFCPTTQGYYPYVKECAAGWQRVAPHPGN